MFHEHETSEYSDFFIIVSNRFGEIFLSKRLKVDFFMFVLHYFICKLHLDTLGVHTLRMRKCGRSSLFFLQATSQHTWRTHTTYAKVKCTPIRGFDFP